MLSSNVRLAQVRRVCLLLVVAACCLAAPRVTAQQAPPDTLKFTGEAAIVLNLVKPEKAADFEAVWKEIKAKLATSDKPELKAFGENLKIYKVDTPPNAQTGVTYLFICDPVSKTQSYNPTALLFESGVWKREEADPIFAKLKDCYNQILPWPLVKIG
jgi:hypothetical protein